MSAVASKITGRRGKWLVLAVWVIAFAALMPLGGKLADETKDDTLVSPRERRVDQGGRDPR